MNEHTEKFNSILNGLKGKEYINAYLQVLEYFKPKLQRSTIVDETPQQITGIRIEYVNTPEDKESKTS